MTQNGQLLLTRLIRAESAHWRGDVWSVCIALSSGPWDFWEDLLGRASLEDKMPKALCLWLPDPCQSRQPDAVRKICTDEDSCTLVALVVKNPPDNAGDVRDLVWSLAQEDPWRRACNPLQYSCLENHMDRGARRAMVHRLAKSRTRLKRLSTAHILHSALP